MYISGTHLSGLMRLIDRRVLMIILIYIAVGQTFMDYEIVQ